MHNYIQAYNSTRYRMAHYTDVLYSDVLCSDVLERHVIYHLNTSTDALTLSVMAVMTYTDTM